MAPKPTPPTTTIPAGLTPLEIMQNKASEYAKNLGSTTTTTTIPATRTTIPATRTTIPATTTTIPSTQPTIPRTGQTTAPTTTTPTQNDVPVGISPNLVNPATLSADGGQYALGVSGRRLYDSKGVLVSYEGYKYTNPTTGVVSQPKYFTGDEDTLYGLSIEALSTLQNAMYGIGRLSKGYSPGVVDSKTTSAYKSLLATANGYGEDFETTIARLASGGAAVRGGQLSQYRVSNDADVRAIMNKVSQQTLGRKLGEGDLNRLSGLYRDLERTAGQASGVEVAQAPQVETFTQNKLEEMFPEDTNARQFGSYLTAIEKKYNL